MQLQLTRADVVLPVPADPRGLSGPTPKQARGRRWRTSSPGLFVPVEDGPPQPAQRIVEAVAGAPEGAAITGWAALHWQGGRWFAGRAPGGEPEPVSLAIGDAGHLAPRRGVRLCQDWLFADDLIRVDGLPLTRTERSVCVDAVRARSLEDAVRLLDMAAIDDLVSIEELRTYAPRLAGRPGTRRLRAAIELAQENVWSPQETTMRLRWQERRGCRLLCNVPVFDAAGRHLLTPDLLDPVAGVLGEYNGSVHDATPARRRDLDREELCRSLRLEAVTMMSTDLVDLTSFDRRLDAAYRRAQRQRPQERPWTLALPDWWVDTSTVARRRALDGAARRRLLPWA